MKPVPRKCRKNVLKSDVFGLGPNMCYINNCNLPRTLPMNHCEVKKLIKNGNLQNLEEKLLNGEGYKLIGHYSANPKIKMFLQSVPVCIARIDMLHDSTCKGNLRDMQVLLENGNPSRNIYKISPTKLICSKDLNGVTVLHKAVYYDFLDIVDWLVTNYPQTVHVKDKTMRIPLHYICSCSDVSRIWDLMLKAGANPNALDINDKTPSYYLEYRENITLPNNCKSDCSDEDISIKPSNIRIWIHECNIKQLAKVIWSGFGDKLLTETSKQATVNKFLKVVPNIMGIIKEIHKSVIEDNIALLKKLNREPVPVEVLGSKDKNGLTPLHKAVGLGRLSIVDYIISKNSKTVNIRDNDGRTPLHYVYAAPPKYITSIYNRLIKAGANENLIDKNGKTPKRNSVKINDITIDLLTVLPKAPRIASEFPASWDWNIFYEISNEKLVEELNSKNTSIQDSKTQNLRSTTGTIKTNSKNVRGMDKIRDMKTEDHIINVENINHLNNNHSIDITDVSNSTAYVDNFVNEEKHVSLCKDQNNFSLDTQPELRNTNDNIHDVDSSKHISLKHKEKNYISLYTQSESQDINDINHDVNNITKKIKKNNENNDSPKKDKNPTSLYTRMEVKDNDDTNDVVSKSNSFTLGEVRQALNNGSLDDILPMGGPVYRTNSSKKTHNVEFFDSNSVKERNSSAQIIVKKGNLDEIADYILDGNHEKLRGIKSDIPEVQDFLGKIPFYADKIEQIHKHCALGDLEGLTQVLDRKKFCLARESKSGLGLTPLHTAVVYEQIDVFGYLAAKFPETLKLIDFHGWTPMDYANTLPDKTFLQQLMNTKINCEEFQTDYHTKPSFGNNSVTLDPEQIRKALGYVTEVVDKEISDTDMDKPTSSGKLLSTVMSAKQFSAEDREYLTKAVGQPLKSGLKELIKRRPSNPTLYLAEYLTNHYDRNDPQSDKESGVSSAVSMIFEN